VTTLIANSVSSIFTPQAEYSDKTISFKQQTVKYEQGFAFNQVAALQNVYDTTVNNYTSNFLTKKTLLTDLLDFNLRQSQRFTITTTIVCNPFLDPVVLKIANPVVTGSDIRTYTFITEPPNFNNSIYFELEFLDGKRLRIKHNNGKQDFFLNIYDREFVTFYNYDSIIPSLKTPRSDIFNYLVDDDGYIQLFFNDYGSNKILVYEDNILRLRDIPLNGLIKSSANLFRINYSYNLPESKINTSWVSYDRNRTNTLSIDQLRSEFDRRSQYFLHTTYSNVMSSYSLNFMTLNNDRSERGFYKRGTNMISRAVNTPDADFREYTSLHTGVDQERGNDNITLNFTFYDKDIIADPGTDTYFTAPSSIYPYEKLNINDTKFTLNGSLGAPSPLIADKIFLQRKNTTQYNNGRYLCTWLSAASTQTPGVWVDRYYYPDILSKRDSQVSPEYTPSFFEVVDRTLTTLDTIDISKSAFFDKKSDLAIEPGTKLKYQRTSSQDIAEIINTSTPFVSGFNAYFSVNNAIVPYESSSIIYNGDRYNRYGVRNINAQKAFTVSFELFVDPQKRLGYQLLGNRTSSGFGVYNNTPITPFVYLKNGKQMFIYNANYILLSVTTFDEDIKDIIIGRPLEDFYVVCEGELVYRVNTAGIKTKAKTVSGIGTYVSYTQDDNNIIFLTPQHTNGISQCVSLSKSLLEGRVVEAKPLPIYAPDPFYYPSSLILYNDQLYTVPGTNVKYSGYNSPELFYIENNKLLRRYNFITNELLTFLKSESRLWDFTIDENKNIVLLHGKSVTMLKSSREVIYTRNFNNFDTLSGFDFLGVDYLRKDSAVEPNAINIVTVLATNQSGELSFIELEIENDDVNIDIYPTSLPLNSLSQLQASELRNYSTNYNYNIVNTSRESTLRFTQTLTNYLSTDDIVTKSYEISLKDIDAGYHTFTYRFDAVQGNITIFVDGNKKINMTLQPGKYKIQEIFTDDFFVGETGFLNGVSLSTYVNIPGLYFVKNMEMNNFLLYDRALTDTEIIALSLFKRPIDSVVLSIPSGQRSNLEEVERMFKYGSISSSKQINVYVKNLNITNEAFVENIKASVLERVRESLPVNVEVKDIIFENYK
jgi:hypothetical protein